MKMYETEAGSIVKLFDQKVTCSFNWAEEPDACIECVVSPNLGAGCLTWKCDKCGGGSAELNLVLLKA